MATKKITLETGGSVWKVLVAEGDAVAAGQTLFILEVMKMEAPYEAPFAGAVSAVHIKEGDPAEEGAVAMEIETKAG